MKSRLYRVWLGDVQCQPCSVTCGEGSVDCGA